LIGNLILAKRNIVAVFQGMLFDQFAVNVGAIGATQVFQERIFKNGNDLRVSATDGQIIDLYVIAWFAPNRSCFVDQLVLGFFARA
jgi:hypothetical protein